MKKILLALICLSNFGIALGQQVTKQEKYKESKKLLQKVEAINKPIGNKKTRSTAYRLIGVTSRNSTSISDSTAYQYFSNYGYDPTLENLPLTNTINSPNNNDFLINETQNSPDKSYTWNYLNGYQLIDSVTTLFNSNHNTISIFDHSYIQTQSSQKDSSLYTYNSNQKVAQITYKSFNTGSNIWENEARESYTYNGNFKIATYMIENWNTTSNNWDQDTKLDIMYSGNNISEVKWSYFDTSTNLWEFYEKTELIYNNNNIIQFKYFEWNGANWDQYQKLEISYNASNYEILNTSYTWDGTTWTFNYDDYKDSLIYNGGQFPSSYISSGWDTTSNSWDLEYKTDYSYTPNNQTQKEDYNNWNATTNAWQYTGNSIYYYELYTTNPSSTVESSLESEYINVFPNPAISYTYISFSTDKAQESKIIVTNIIGKQVFTTTEQSSIGDHLVKIPVHHLPSGLYIIQLKVGDAIYQTKFIKQ